MRQSWDWIPPSSPELIADARAHLTPELTVGLAMRRHRLDVGLSQRELAGKLGWSDARVGRLESGAGSLRVPVVVQGLCVAGYDVDLDEGAACSGGPATPHARPFQTAGRAPDEGRHTPMERASSVTRRYLEDGGLSQRELARQCEVSPAFVRRVIRGSAELKFGGWSEFLARLGAQVVLRRRNGTDAGDAGDGVGRLAVSPDDWSSADLLNIVRGGGRRLAGHFPIRECPAGPRWWLMEPDSMDIRIPDPRWTTEQ